MISSEFWDISREKLEEVSSGNSQKQLFKTVLSNSPNSEKRLMAEYLFSDVSELLNKFTKENSFPRMFSQKFYKIIQNSYFVKHQWKVALEYPETYLGPSQTRCLEWSFFCELLSAFSFLT